MDDTDKIEELPPAHDKERLSRNVTKYDLWVAGISCGVLFGSAFIAGVFFEIDNKTILKWLVPVVVLLNVGERIVRKKLISSRKTITELERN